MDRIDQATVFFEGKLCGVLSRTNNGYTFQYAAEYIQRADAKPLSRSLPLQKEPFESHHFFPFFAGLVSDMKGATRKSAAQSARQPGESWSPFMISFVGFWFDLSSGMAITT